VLLSSPLHAAVTVFLYSPSWAGRGLPCDPAAVRLSVSSLPEASWLTLGNAALLVEDFKVSFLSCSSFLYYTWAMPHGPAHSRITFVTKWRGQLNIHSLVSKCNGLLAELWKMYHFIS
jgi:hypothetical protein